MTDDPIFINDESRPAANESLLVEDAVLPDHLPLDVGEKRECHADVFLEAIVSRIAVNADAQNLRVILLEFGNISLIRLQFLRSTARKGKHVEG